MHPQAGTARYCYCVPGGESPDAQWRRALTRRQCRISLEKRGSRGWDKERGVRASRGSCRSGSGMKEHYVQVCARTHPLQEDSPPLRTPWVIVWPSEVTPLIQHRRDLMST